MMERKSRRKKEGLTESRGKEGRLERRKEGEKLSGEKD